MNYVQCRSPSTVAHKIKKSFVNIKRFISKKIIKIEAMDSMTKKQVKMNTYIEIYQNAGGLEILTSKELVKHFHRDEQMASTCINKLSTLKNMNTMLKGKDYQMK